MSDIAYFFMIALSLIGADGFWDMQATDCVKLFAMITASGMAITGLLLVGCRLKAKDQGFGPNSLKALGIVLFLPVLVIVSVVVPDFRSETVAALLGTAAGYVLSSISPGEG